MQRLNIKFTFYCRSSYQNNEDQSPIVLRILFRGERKDLFTGFYCHTESWDIEHQKVKRTFTGSEKINRALITLIENCKFEFDRLKYSGDVFTINDIAKVLKGNEERPKTLIEFLKEGNEKLKARIGVDIIPVTYKKYERSLRYLQQFLETQYKMEDYPLQKVDRILFEKYYHYLRTERQIAHNTSCKYLVCVKSIFLPAIKSGILKFDPFYGIKITPKQVIKQFLTQEELDRIINVLLSDPDLDRKRDIFVFACFTGLAYSDLKQLSRKYFTLDNDGSWFISKPRQKTGQNSIIPLLPIARRILEKYSTTKRPDDFEWQVSSNQKMNKGLFYIAKRAKIDKHLHMHLARHTFATTVTLSNGVPIESVSKMLGHASISQTQHYAKVIPLKVKNDMERLKRIYK